MTQHPYDQVDNLFAQIRLRLLEIRHSDPETVEELKSLVSQLEDCVEQLVIDYLKLRSLEGKKVSTPKSGKGGQGKQSKDRRSSSSG